MNCCDITWLCKKALKCCKIHANFCLLHQHPFQQRPFIVPVCNRSEVWTSRPCASPRVFKLGSMYRVWLNRAAVTRRDRVPAVNNSLLPSRPPPFFPPYCLFSLALFPSTPCDGWVLLKTRRRQTAIELLPRFGPSLNFLYWFPQL